MLIKDFARLMEEAETAYERGEDTSAYERTMWAYGYLLVWRDNELFIRNRTPDDGEMFQEKWGYDAQTSEAQ